MEHRLPNEAVAVQRRDLKGWLALGRPGATIRFAIVERHGEAAATAAAGAVDGAHRGEHAHEAHEAGTLIEQHTVPIDGEVHQQGREALEPRPVEGTAVDHTVNMVLTDGRAAARAAELPSDCKELVDKLQERQPLDRLAEQGRQRAHLLALLGWQRRQQQSQGEGLKLINLFDELAVVVDKGIEASSEGEGNRGPTDERCLV